MVNPGDRPQPGLICFTRLGLELLLWLCFTRRVFRRNAKPRLSWNRGCTSYCAQNPCKLQAPLQALQICLQDFWRRLSRACRMIAPNVAVPMPSSLKAPNAIEKLPAPSTNVTAATIRFLLLLKSTWLTTQIRAPATAIRPKTTTDIPPRTGPGISWIRAPNFGEKPSKMAMPAAMTNTSDE